MQLLQKNIIHTTYSDQDKNDRYAVCAGRQTMQYAAWSYGSKCRFKNVGPIVCRDGFLDEAKTIRAPLGFHSEIAYNSGYNFLKGEWGIKALVFLIWARIKITEHHL